MQSIGKVLIALLFVLLASCAPAMAETISVPVGNWTSQFLDITLAVFAATASIVVAWLGRSIGGPLGTLLITAHVDQILVKAVAYGVNVTKGATTGKTYDFEVASPIILAAYRYFEEAAPYLIVQFAGTKEQIIQKIIARLPLAEGVEIAPHNVATLANQA